MPRRSPIPPEKLSDGPLFLLDWLCGRPPGERMASTAALIRSGAVLQLMELDPASKDGLARIHPGNDPDALAMLGGREPTDLRTLDAYALERFQRSSIEPPRPRGVGPGAPGPGAAAVLARHGREAFGYTDNVYLATPRTIEIWEAGVKAEAATRRAARAAAEAASDRLVLVGAAWVPEYRLPRELAGLLPDGFRMPVGETPSRRPYAVARVRRETASRLYIRDAEVLGRGGGYFRDVPIHGSGASAYVDRADVIADGIRPEAAARIAEALAEEEAARGRAADRMLAAIAGPLAEWRSALAQAEARREDEMGEILGPAAPARPPGP